MGCCGTAARKSTLKIKGMSCTHCQKSVEKALKSVEGVEEAVVDLAAGEAVVTYDPGRVTEEELKQAVIRAGYEVA